MIMNPFIDGFSFGSIGSGSEAPETSSSAHSDEEVILASSRPKKRAGRKKFKETRHPVYRGVRQRNGNRWVCELRAPNNKTRVWLGTYPTAEMAARAHDVAALAFRGHGATINFADSAWRLPVPVSSDTRDIQKAAAEAAEAFRPQQNNEEETQKEKNVSRNNNNCNVGYVDEEEVFQMPRLLANMAEGLLLSPPLGPYGSVGWNDTDNNNDDCEISLWSYTI